MAHMDAENKALAYVLGHPPAEWAAQPLSYVRIAERFVKKPDGSRPDTPKRFRECVAQKGGMTSH